MLRLYAMLQVRLKVWFEVCFVLAVGRSRKRWPECANYGKRQILVVPPPNSAGTVPEAFTATLPARASAVSDHPHAFGLKGQPAATAPLLARVSH